jgi:hypothetical protein
MYRKYETIYLKMAQWNKLPCHESCPKEKLDWSFLPNMHCISMLETSERTDRARKEFCRVGMCDQVTFYQPQRETSAGKNSGAMGCWNSHREVCINNKGLVTVYEDDVVFHKDMRNKRNTIEECVKYAFDNFDCDIFYLGTFPGFTRRTKNHKIRQVSACWGTHAYITGDSVSKWLEDNPFGSLTGFYTGIPLLSGPSLPESVNFIGIDRFYNKFKNYCIYPMVAFQAGNTEKSTSLNTISNNSIIKTLVSYANESNAKIMEESLKEEDIWSVILIIIAIVFLVLITIKITRDK